MMQYSNFLRSRFYCLPISSECLTMTDINHVFWESRIDLPIKKSEKSALIDFINHRNYPENSIITADRGYESYNLIAHCIENNQKFVFRVKDIDTRTVGL